MAWQKATAQTLNVTLYKSGVPTAPTGALAATISKDGTVFAAIAGTVAKIGTTPACYLSLTVADTNCDTGIVRITDSGAAVEDRYVEFTTEAAYTATVAGRIDEAISAAKTLVDGAITAAKVADGAIDDAALAADTDTYQARVELIDDDNGTTDRYIVVWYKNSQPVTSGITVPTIQVVKCADGADLVAEAALTQVGALGLWHKAETTNRVVSGVAYIAKVTATIDAATRTWYEPVGRDT